MAPTWVQPLARASRDLMAPICPQPHPITRPACPRARREPEILNHELHDAAEGTMIFGVANITPVARVTVSRRACASGVSGAIPARQSEFCRVNHVERYATLPYLVGDKSQRFSSEVRRPDTPEDGDNVNSRPRFLAIKSVMPP